MSNQNKLLSVIIPTYNMEALLPQCLDSLLVKEGKEKLDVLVVNDGSKDCSSEIAHQYADNYPETFRVIDKENGNYGSCINAALPLILGKYVKILDADDSYETKNLEDYLRLLDKLDVDLVLTDYASYDMSGNQCNYSDLSLPQKKVFEFKIIPPNTYIAMHKVTYRSSIFQEFKYHQTEGVSYTDTEWIFHPMSKVNNVYYYPTLIYKYLAGREGQTMDDNVMLKRLNHEEKGIMSMIDEIRTVNKECQAYGYMDSLLNWRIARVYILYISNKNVDFDLLSFDRNLYSKDSRLYEQAQYTTLSSKFMNIKTPIVKLWRKTKNKNKMFLYPSYLLYRIGHFIDRRLS